MSDPLLSVTITNYNYAKYVERAIDSVLAQTFTDFELLVIDNASSDNSPEILRKYAALDRRIRVVEHPENLGMFASLREACELSTGRYRVHVEADDWVLADDAFAVQLDMLERNPATVFVYSAMTMVGSDGEVFNVSRPYPNDVVVRGAEALEAILSFALTHTGMMMRLDSLRATNGYRSEFPHVPDMALAVELCDLGDVGYVARSLYAFRQHGSNLHLEPQWHMLRDEMAPLIEEAFTRPAAARLPDPDVVRRRVTRRAAQQLPLQYIFSGHPAVGWRLYWESVKVWPLVTIVQPQTLVLVARTLLGRRGYARLERLMRRKPR